MTSDFDFVFYPILAEFKFVGWAFFFSLFFLWFMVQGLIWLSQRYSRLISTTNWWRSAIITFISTILMVIGWNVPSTFTGSEHLVHSMTSAIIIGAIGTWFLSGYLYNFEFVHRFIVAIGVPLLVFCASALGLVVYGSVS